MNLQATTTSQIWSGGESLHFLTTLLKQDMLWYFIYQIKYSYFIINIYFFQTKQQCDISDFIENHLFDGELKLAPRPQV